MSGSTVPALLVPQTRAVQLVTKVGTGAALPAGSTIVTGSEVVPVAPQ